MTAALARFSKTQIALLALLLTLAVMLFANYAFAQAGGTAGRFYCSGGQAHGELYVPNASCPTTLQMDNVFSFLICNMETLSSNLMGSMYCGMISALVPAVMAVLTLAVIFFGIGFTIGVIPATARDFQKFMIKVAFIAVFATQADYLIGFGYKFLITGAREGIAVALSGLYAPPGATTTTVTGAEIYGYLDRFLGRAMMFATDYIGNDWGTDRNPCQNAIFAVMAIMAVAFPPLFFICVLIIFKIILTFLRAVFGYVYALIGIAFLLTLAPFFLSFGLFTQTKPFFDKWLGYLASMALQMVLVFAFLAFIVSIDVKHISGSLVSIIVPVEDVKETTSLRLPWRYCTLCEFKVINTDTGAEIPESEFEEFIGKGEMQCRENPGRPIRVFDATAPDPGKAPNRQIQNALLKFAATGLLSLLILAYIIDALLRYIPALAQYLASGMGAPYTPQLAGGESVRSIPTMEMPMGDVIDRFGDNYARGYQAATAEGGSSLHGATRGLADAMSMLVTGRDTQGRGSQSEPGMGGRFIRFLTNPHGDTHD